MRGRARNERRGFASRLVLALTTLALGALWFLSSDRRVEPSAGVALDGSAREESARSLRPSAARAVDRVSEEAVQSEEVEHLEDDEHRVSATRIRNLLGAPQGPRTGVRGVLELAWDDPEATCQVAVTPDGSRRWIGNTRRLEVHEPFELFAREPGSYHLHFFVPGHGAAHLAGVELTKPPSELPAPVRLTGPGVVRVLVVDHEGRPTPGQLVSVALDATWDERADVRWNATGNADGSFVTGADGRGELRGLTPGRYHLGIYERSVERGRIVRRTDAPVPADGRETRLVHTDPRIVVNLVGRTDEERAWTPPKNRRPAPWPVVPEVVLQRLELARGDSEPRWVTAGVEAEPLAPDRLRYDVAPGFTYRVTVLGGDREARHATVDVPRGAGQVEVTLELAPRREPGRLVLVYPGPAPLAPDSGPTTGDAFDYYLLYLWEAATGVLLKRSLLVRASQSEQALELPPGTYGVEVTGVTMSSQRPTSFGLDRFSVVLEPGVELRHALASEPAARLELSSLVEGGAPPAAVDEVDPWHRSDEILYAWLERPDGFDHPVTFVGWEDRIGTGHVTGPWAWDELAARSLPSGTYILRARLDDEREASTSVVLTPGATTRAELVFPPEPETPERYVPWWKDRDEAESGR